MHGICSGSAARRRLTASPRAPWNGGRRGRVLGGLLGLGGTLGLLGLLGCKDLTGSQSLPAGTVNPAFYYTPSGAYGMRTKALYDLAGTLPPYLVATGLLTDELVSNLEGRRTIGVFGDPGRSMLDARVLPELGYGGGASPADVDYLHLQRARAELGQAEAALTAYDTGAKAIGDPTVLRAEMVALTGYTEILLADLFCSGIPLSTLDFQRDYTYHAADSTAQVYRAAIAKEDQALALAGTNSSIGSLARVLKGRALLALDSVAAAAQVVAPVPDGFVYTIEVDFHDPSVSQTLYAGDVLDAVATVSDDEGRTGLPYITSHDPRTRSTIVVPAGTFGYNAVDLTFPAKFSPTTYNAFPIADAVEARLIQAEAALRAGDASWLTTLNALRTAGSVALPADTLVDTLGVTGCPPAGLPWCGTETQQFQPAGGQPPGYPPVGYTLTDSTKAQDAATVKLSDGSTVQSYCYNFSWYQPCYSGGWLVVYTYVRPAQTQWPAGTGGVGGLASLPDPGAALSGAAADSARVALLFQERAYWQFLTGHRQGDLRRLLRSSVYRRWFTDQAQVYPTGAYPAPVIGQTAYGSDVTAPIPGTEYLNPLFHGCIDRKP